MAAALDLVVDRKNALSSAGFEVPDVDIPATISMAAHQTSIPSILEMFSEHNNVRLNATSNIGPASIPNEMNIFVPFYGREDGVSLEFAVAGGGTHELVRDANPGVNILAGNQAVSVNFNPVLLQGALAITDPSASGFKEVEGFTGFNLGGGIEAISRTLAYGSSGVVARSTLVPPLMPAIKLIHAVLASRLNDPRVLVDNEAYLAALDTAQANDSPAPAAVLTPGVFRGYLPNGVLTPANRHLYATEITYNTYCKMQYSDRTIDLNWRQMVAQARRDNAVVFVPYRSSMGLNVRQIFQIAYAFTGLNCTYDAHVGGMLADTGYFSTQARMKYNMPFNSTVHNVEGWQVDGLLVVLVDMDCHVEYLPPIDIGTFGGAMINTEVDVQPLTSYLQDLLGDYFPTALFHAAHTANWRVPSWRVDNHIRTPFEAVDLPMVRAHQPVIVPHCAYTQHDCGIVVPYAPHDAIHFSFVRVWKNKVPIDSYASLFYMTQLFAYDAQSKIVSKIVERNDDVLLQYAGYHGRRVVAATMEKYFGDRLLARVKITPSYLAEALPEYCQLPFPGLPAAWIPMPEEKRSDLAATSGTFGFATTIGYTRHFLYQPVAQPNYYRDGRNFVLAASARARSANAAGRQLPLGSYLKYYGMPSSVMRVEVVQLVTPESSPFVDCSQARSFRHDGGVTRLITPVEIDLGF